MPPPDRRGKEARPCCGGLLRRYHRAGGTLRRWSGGDDPATSERVRHSRRRPAVRFARFGPAVPCLLAGGAVKIRPSRPGSVTLSPYREGLPPHPGSSLGCLLHAALNVMRATIRPCPAPAPPPRR